jgi:hypothetical protein
MILAVTGLCASAKAQNVLFDFDNAPVHTSLPIDLTVGGITAGFSATWFYNYSIQPADTLGFTPIGFSGLCIYPNTVFPDDFLIGFTQKLTGFSILYAFREYNCDPSATMRVTAYLDDPWVATSTMTTQEGVWPTATLSLHSKVSFNNVVVHYDSPPTGEPLSVSLRFWLGGSGGFPPGLPQTRTCATHAYGSSGYGFTPPRYPSVFHGYVSEAQSPRRSSSQRFRNPTPPSLHRVSAGSDVPASSVLRGATTPGRPFRRASFSFAWRYHPYTLFSFSHRRGVTRRGPGDFALRRRGLPIRLLSTGDDRVSHVPREPSCAYALFFDPGRTVEIRPLRSDGSVPVQSTTRTPTNSHFRGSIARPQHSLSTLRRTDRSATTQDSLPATGQFYRTGFQYPQGSSERFQS